MRRNTRIKNQIQEDHRFDNPMHKGAHLLMAIIFKCNKFGHKAVNCRSIQCYSCKMFGHKASLCRNHVVNRNNNLVVANKKCYNFQGHCYNCNNYGPKASQCIYISHWVIFEKKIASCLKCNQLRHYANQCRKG